MRVVLIFVFLIFCTTVLYSQKIANVHSFQEDGKVIIFYDLLSSDLRKKFIASAELSTDDGKTFSHRLASASGDINKAIKPGLQKQIIWDAQKDGFTTGSFIFKIDAIPYIFEIPKPISIRDVVFSITNIKRVGKDVVVYSSAQNTSKQTPSQVALHVVDVTDDSGKKYSVFSGQIEAIQRIERDNKINLTFTIENVDAKVIYFSNLEIKVSSVVYRIQNALIE